MWAGLSEKPNIKFYFCYNRDFLTILRKQKPQRTGVAFFQNMAASAVRLKTIRHKTRRIHLSGETAQRLFVQQRRAMVGWRVVGNAPSWGSQPARQAFSTSPRPSPRPALSCYYSLITRSPTAAKVQQTVSCKRHLDFILMLQYFQMSSWRFFFFLSFSAYSNSLNPQWILYKQSVYKSVWPPSSSLQRSFWGVKDLALGNLGGGPSISEPRVLQKKEELLEESLTTGLSSLRADPTTSGSQATINNHLGLCYRLYVGGDGRQALAFRQICGTPLKGLRTAETPFWTSAQLHECSVALWSAPIMRACRF